MKVGEAGRIVSVAVTLAVAVNDHGRREVQAETFWTDFLRSLVRRGLRDVKRGVCDNHKGLKAAVTRILGATSQRCRAPFRPMPASRADASSRPSPRTMTREPGPRRASSPTSSGPGCRSSPPSRTKPKEDVRASMTFPGEHRQKGHSTNPLERLHAEIKRRTNVVGIFPDEKAITRLAGAILLEQTHGMSHADP